MKLFDAYGRVIESRASYKEPGDWLRDALTGGNTSTAGESVSSASALTVMAFFACVRNISEDIVKLPWSVRQQRGRTSVELPNHPVSRLIHRPSEEMSPHSFWETFVSHAIIYQNAFAERVNLNDGSERFALLDPTKARIVRHPVTDKLYVHVRGEMDSRDGLDIMQVINLHGLGPDGISGYSVSTLARELLGSAIALQKYRGAFFGNGAQPSGILTHPASLSDVAQERLRRQFKERYSGASASHSVMTLEEGMSWQQVSIDPERAQMVDLTHITVEDICRIFRMPPHKIQHLQNATFSNIEHQGLEYDRDTLDPWVQRLRSELNFKLFSERERAQGIGIHINLNALMRADIATRTAYFKDMYYMGAMSAADISELEDRPQPPQGDRYFVQANLVPADMVDKVLMSKSTPAPVQNDSRMRDGLAAMLAGNISTLFKIEIDRAWKKTRTEAESFYSDGERANYIRKRLRDSVVAAAHAMAADVDVDALINEYSAMHCAQSRCDIESGNIEHWTDGTRAATAARWILEQMECTNSAV